MSRIARWWDALTLPQALAFAAGLGALYLFRDHLPADPDGWKQWLEVAGYALAALATGGTLLNGRPRPAEAVVEPPSRGRTERRERGTMPPPAALLLLVVATGEMVGCTPAGKAAFERVLLSAAEYAVKFGAEAIEHELATSGGEEP